MTIRMADAEIRLQTALESCGQGPYPGASGDLRAQGIDAEVVEAVLLLTRRPDVAGDDYYARIAEHPIAREVKLADIADNTDPARTARLDPEVRDRLAKKYEKARHALGAGEEHR